MPVDIEREVFVEMTCSSDEEKSAPKLRTIDNASEE